jgi:hypothetical protein
MGAFFGAVAAAVVGALIWALIADPVVGFIMLVVAAVGGLFAAKK